MASWSEICHPYYYVYSPARDVSVPVSACRLRDLGPSNDDPLSTSPNSVLVCAEHETWALPASQPRGPARALSGAAGWVEVPLHPLWTACAAVAGGAGVVCDLSMHLGARFPDAEQEEVVVDVRWVWVSVGPAKGSPIATTERASALARHVAMVKSKYCKDIRAARKCTRSSNIQRARWHAPSTPGSRADSLRGTASLLLRRATPGRLEMGL